MSDLKQRDAMFGCTGMLMPENFALRHGVAEKSPRPALRHFHAQHSPALDHEKCDGSNN